MTNNLWLVYKGLLGRFNTAVSLWMTELYSQYLERNLKDTTYFAITQKEMEQHTNLSEDRQTYIIKKLVNSNLIKVRKRGLPAQNYYQINFKRLEEIISGRNTTTTCVPQQQEQEPVESKDKIQEKPSANNNITNKPTIPEINSSCKEENSNNSRYEPAEPATKPPSPGKALKELVRIKPTGPNKKKKKDVWTLSKVPKNIQDLFQFWKELSFNKKKLVQSRPNSKVTKEAVETITAILAGKHEHFPKLDEEQIRMLFYKHSLEALHDDYEPRGKFKETLRNITIKDFFWDSYRSENSTLKSRCLYLMKAEPVKCTDSIMPVKSANNDCDMATKRLTALFSQKEGEPRKDQATKNKFIRAGNMLHDFCIKNHQLRGTKAYELAEDLIESIKAHFGHVNVGNLCSDYTYKKIFPDYLSEMGGID